MAFVGFGGFNRANQAAILQQQANDMRQAQAIFQSIGYVPQGGVTNTHGNVHKAVDFGGAKTFNTMKGLGIDLDGNGKFEAGKDGHLALDLDGNGIYDQNDVRDTKRMLELFSGKSNDSKGTATGFGGFNQAAQAKDLMLQARGKQIDLNQDGVLSSWELARMGGRALGKGKANSPAFQRPLPGVVATAPRPFGGYPVQPGYGAPVFGGYPVQPGATPPFVGSGYQAPNAAQTAFFYQVVQNFMSMFARPY